ncbi:MAG: aminoacyl-tRNA hydrolase [Clostridia bacterium]
MKVIVGLGNPGKEYEKTRHNIGFIMIDKLAETYNVEFTKKAHKAQIGEANINGEKVLFVKPQTFMNLSGECVRDIASFYKVQPQDILVIYDDIDIPFETIRFRDKGSAGTHNGMKNIVSLMHSQEVSRIRVGIFVERNPNILLMDFVLQKFSGSELQMLDKIYMEVEEKVQNYLTK